MEFRQLRYFVAVAEDGNIGAAAKRLHVSQPPVTRQIQALEQNLGVTLFLRTHRGVELTAAGKAFLGDARRLLELAGSSGERSRSAARGELGEVRVAYLGTAIYRRLPLLLKAFLKEVPGATVTLRMMNKGDQIEALRNKRIDIGFGRFYPEEAGITILQITTERLFLAVAQPQVATVGSRPTLAELRNLPLILFPRGGRPSFADEVIGLFKRAGVEPRISAVVEDVNAALALTVAGVGATLVPASVAAIPWPDIQFFDLAEPRAEVPVSCVYRTSDPLPILASFLALLRDAGQAEASG